MAFCDKKKLTWVRFITSKSFDFVGLRSSINLTIRHKVVLIICDHGFQTFYFVLPFFGKQSMKLKDEVESLLKKFYPFMNLRLVLRNNFRIGSLFNFKDIVPKACRSAVVYKFSCPSCEGTYIGSTYVRLYSRVCQHQGKSDRTKNFLTSPVASSIRDHSLDCDTPFSIDDFKIIDMERSSFSLRILESLYIFKTKPSLNDKTSAFKLNIVT